MLSSNQPNEGAKSSAIKENEMVNIHITSSGALYALTLIHLKSNNEQIASRLELPMTFHSLESVRPGLLLQKVFCKNLIMWDKIGCSQKWVDDQLPTLIKRIYESDINKVDKDFSMRIFTSEIDYATIALCFVNILTGAILSIGFKFAGTGNQGARNCII